MRKILFLCLLIVTGSSNIIAQGTDDLIPYAKTHRGNALYVRFGIHDGNRVAITFRNSGQIGGTDPQDIRGAWPYPMTQDSYIGDVTPLVAVELPGTYPIGVSSQGSTIYGTVHSVTISPGPRNGQSAKVDPTDGHFQGAEPEPGYVNFAQDTVALSNIPSSWPSFWPDHPDWKDSTGAVQWNGYFGRNQFSADQESYWVMDDAPDNSVQQRTNNQFHPDSTDTTRNGIGIVVACRGMQWSQVQAQDVLFWLYDITNIGTTTYRKTDFGEIVGGCVGDVGQDYVDCSDDLGFFDVNNNLTYSWDSDDKTADPLWICLSTVLTGVRNCIGYCGYAYLESPGNPYDGIDNDNDAVDPTSPQFQQTDFTFSSVSNSYVSSRTLSRTNAGSNPSWPNNEIILIDPATYARQIVLLDTLLKSDTDTETVYSLGVPYKIYNGEVLIDTVNNGLDDNLNGLIDENYSIHYERVFKTTTGVVYRTDLRPLYYKDYFTGGGLNNTMIDESRNSGPGTIVTGWVPDYTQPRDPVTGKYPGVVKTHWSGDENGNWNPKTDDVGADGEPNTHDLGEGDGIPTEGEPDFDEKDVNESDQIGLTSFNFFNQTASPPMNNSETLWSRMVPGYFDVIPALPQDGDFIYSSGYFPLLPLQTERFSLALVFGADSNHIFQNKQIVQRIYDKNYDFVQPPPKPHVTAVAGDKKVTLTWDNGAEKAASFEGYKIYRSTDPGFTEAGGAAIATFDRIDEVTGYFLPPSQDIAGLPTFYLGSDNGLVHTYTDSGLENGQAYYYAVTAYTTGDEQSDTYPAEDPKYVTVASNGQVRTDVNTIFITPQAPTSGYLGPNVASLLSPVGYNEGTGKVYLSVVNPNEVPNRTFRVGFVDTSNGIVPVTTGYYVIDYTQASSPDTITFSNNGGASKIRLSSSQVVGDIDEFVFDGMYITVNNDWNCVVNASASGWSTTHSLPNLPYTFAPLKISGIKETGIAYPEDYLFVFDSAPNDADTSTAITLTRINTLTGAVIGQATLPKLQSNFRVYDRHTGLPIPYGFQEPNCANFGQDCGVLAPLDRVFFFVNGKTSSGQDSTYFTWFLSVNGQDSTNHLPSGGDTLRLVTAKPFVSTDQLEVTTTAAIVNDKLASNQLDLIRVVPNPYVAATSQEPPLPPTITSGRGTRKISFIHLPPNSTIYIYTSRGELVKKLQMPPGQSISDGDVDWDLTTNDNLEVAYGVYFFLVDAPGVGQKTGKLAIIK
ncbi:MAG: hypothetical protein WAO19_02820 [Candidatus Kryptoniota bacterium]